MKLWNSAYFLWNEPVYS